MSERIAAKAVVEPILRMPRRMMIPVEQRMEAIGTCRLGSSLASVFEKGGAPSRAKAHNIREVVVRRPTVAKDADIMILDVIADAAAAFPFVMKWKMEIGIAHV